MSARIIPLLRTLRTPSLAHNARCMASGNSSNRGTVSNAASHMSEKAPPSKKAHNPKKDTSSHFNKDGGWAEESASTSEAAVKADRDHHGNHDDPIKLQKESTDLLNKKNKKSGGR